VKADKSFETAIGARDDALLADHASKPFKPLRYELGMLDKVGLGVDHADNQGLVVW
jgi:hypothetical protein